MMPPRWIALFTLGSALLLRADVSDLRKEPDPIRRFDRAIDLAETQTRAARQLVKDSGSRTELLHLLEEVEAATVLSLESLRQTGKKPAKLTRQYKKGEQKTLEIVRLLQELVLALSIDDRPPAEKVRDRVDVTHEEYLLGVMSGK